MKMKTYQSKYYHNEHSNQRDRFLIENFGEDWLNDMKSKGYFGGDWPEEIIGNEKDGLSIAYDKDGNIFKTEEIYLDASSN